MNNSTFNIISEQVPATQKVTFIENQLPVLTAGTYDINITQNTSGTGKGNHSVQDTFVNSRKIYVGADRFSIHQDDLYSVFPPKSYSGDVSSILPNIVFSNPSLPWQRDIDPSVNTAKDINGDEKQVPWLALLLFHTDDTIPEIQNVSLEDLSTNLPPDTLFPTLTKLEPGQSASDLCRVIDVPTDLFNTISPTAQDMIYLSHIREVDMTSKEAALEYDYHPQNGVSLKTKSAEQQFSVVMCNRLPKPDSQCHLFLVSYENMGSYLPTSDGTPSPKTDKSKVRLVVLEDWEFYATQTQKKIADVVQNLNRISKNTVREPFSAPVTFRFPEVENPNNDPSTDTINNAFEMGYVPLDHQMRTGGHTISWQRSPFIPYLSKEVMDVPKFCSDQLMRYNPDNGMFDTTYASAWQLGRLLCIQNKGFAYQLFEWKRGKNKTTIYNTEQQALGNALLPESAQKTDESLLSENLIESVIAPLLSALFNEENSFSGTEINLQTERLKALETLLLDPELRTEAIRQTVEDDPITKLIIDWLSKLRLLNGVPYRYLVPHRDLLPTESIKLFFIDSNYTTMLIDGAYSIGRYTEDDLSFDQASFEVLNAHIQQRSLQWRKRIFGFPLQNETSGASIMTGFLLNSSLVSSFPGLEVSAIDGNNNSLDLLRMERLSGNILLCIFNGELDSIQISQPPEGLFFGLDSNEGTFHKNLRNPNQGDDLGKILPNTKVSTIPFRGNTHVVNIFALASSIKTTLMDSNNTFTAADFALQMTEGVERVTLTQKPKQ